MKWSKWWPRLAEIPAIVLAGVAVILQILRYTKIWAAPVDPIDQAVLLVALLVISFFSLRQRIEHLEHSVEDAKTTELFRSVHGRDEIDAVTVELLRDTPLAKDDEIALITIMSARGLVSDQIGRLPRSSQLMHAALTQRIREGQAVRRLILVQDKKDLDFVVTQYISRFNDLKKSNYEVRVLIKSSAPPPAPLLLVGPERALVGLFGEGAGGAMKNAFVLYGAETGILAHRHFQVLWDWPSIHRLRPHEMNKLDQVAYDCICAEIEQNSDSRDE